MWKTGQVISLAIQKYTANLTNQGTLYVRSGEYTGRCPSAKRTVRDNETENTVDWSANQTMDSDEWQRLFSCALTYIDTWEEYKREFYTIKGTAGRCVSGYSFTSANFKFICENPVQIQFIKNMFDCSTQDHDDIECEVYCVPEMSKEPIVAINFSEKKIIISGTKYLGEIKKSVFTYMNYMLTPHEVLPMHCSVNVDTNLQNPAIFFGLSGTGKTTLSSSPDRVLLGDDEHGWAPGLIFNIESGCYAKTAGLSVKTEPEIFRAANQFGAIFENVVVNKGEPDFYDTSLSKNGRVSYPLSHIENYVETGYVRENPKNVIMLTCDAFGVLPPVSKLTKEKAKEMFLVGYTSKVAGTETGVTEPQTVFSPCFGAPFLPRPPEVYGQLLEKYVAENNVDCWLVNTGWIGGGYGVGDRMPLDQTRAIIQSILSGELSTCKFYTHDQTGFMIPTVIPSKKDIQTFPERAWKDSDKYEEAANILMSSIDAKIREL